MTLRYQVAKRAREKNLVLFDTGSNLKKRPPLAPKWRWVLAKCDKNFVPKETDQILLGRSTCASFKTLYEVDKFIQGYKA